MSHDLMRTYALGAQELARVLYAAVVAEGGALGTDALAMRTACERACRNLSRSLGGAGFDALLTRALSQAELDYPFLTNIRIERGGELVLGGLDALVAQHGSSAVNAALESMLATMLGLLGRLIGDDMVPRLLEHNAPNDTHADRDAK